MKPIYLLLLLIAVLSTFTLGAEEREAHASTDIPLVAAAVVLIVCLDKET